MNKTMYMDGIQYTYKLSKLLLILYIHENERYILENSRPVKPKIKSTELVCVCELEHIKTNLSLHKI